MVRMAQNPSKQVNRHYPQRDWVSNPSEMVLIACSIVRGYVSGGKKGNLTNR